MKTNPFIRISAAIFILFAVIISLFPPFEFGNEKLRTISERRTNSDIADKLPIKKYDFIFGSNKKNIILDYQYSRKRFYNKDDLMKYKKIHYDKEFNYILSSKDTFYTCYKYLFKLNKKNVNYLFIYSKHYEERTDPPWEEHLVLNSDTNSIHAINYNEVKADYEKQPEYWDYGYSRSTVKNRIKGYEIRYFPSHQDSFLCKYDSVKNYDGYSIAKPIYFLLDRKILLGELMIEYILAFFISIVLGLAIQVVKNKKYFKF